MAGLLSWVLSVAFLMEVSRCGADPCLDYYNLGIAQRSVIHTLTKEQTAICDEYTIDETRWARFKQYTGEKMAEFCPELYKCGTEGPIWMNGSHPSDYSEKSVQACLNLGGCCDRSWDIQVRRCKDDAGDFFVYKLKLPGTGCSVAYCAGDKEPCPRYSIWNSTLNTCACYRNDTCPIDLTEAPLLDNMTAVEQHPGESIDITINGIKIYNGNIVCEVTYVMISGQTVTEFPSSTVTSSGTYVTYYAAICTLPPLPTDVAAFNTAGGKTNGWKIRLSNNGGSEFSEAIVFPAINSACHSCGEDGCKIKANVCFVQGQCHQAGDSDSRYPCLQCNPAVATDGWVATNDMCMPSCKTGTRCTFTREQYDTVTPPRSTTTPTGTPIKTTSTTEGSVSTIPAGAGGWNSWSPWSTCPKKCDYGIGERRRSCEVSQSACPGTAIERRLCNTFNCPEREADLEQGVILLIRIVGLHDDILLKLVLSEADIIQFLVENINIICIGNVSKCCQRESGNILGGSARFVTWNDAPVASGYPKVLADISVVSLKVVVHINPQADQLICGRTSRSKRDLNQGSEATYIPRSVLEEAIKKSLPQIENKTGLAIQGYLLPGNHRQTPTMDSPTTKTPPLPTTTIVAIAMSVIVAIISVTAIVIVLVKRKTKPTINDSTQKGHVNEPNNGGTSGENGEYYHGPQEVREAFYTSVKPVVYYEQSGPYLTNEEKQPPADSHYYDTIQALETKDGYDDYEDLDKN